MIGRLSKSGAMTICAKAWGGMERVGLAQVATRREYRDGPVLGQTGTGLGDFGKAPGQLALTVLAFAEPPAQPAFQEGLDLPVEHRLHVSHLDAGADGARRGDRA